MNTPEPTLQLTPPVSAPGAFLEQWTSYWCSSRRSLPLAVRGRRCEVVFIA